VVVIAVAALAFFLPSLLWAGVPMPLWLPFSLMAGLAAVAVSLGFLYIPRESPATLLTPFTNAAAMAIIGIAFRPYFHALDLLYPLLVSGHAILHGLAPALLAILSGTFVVAFAIHDPTMANLSDVGYTWLYLTGSALLPWTARRLAERRAHLLRASKRDAESERERLQAVLRSMADAVVVVQSDGRLVVTNAAYDELAARLGGASGRIEPLDERGRRMSRARWPEVRAGRGDSFEMSFTLQPPSGERRWYEARGGPIGTGLGFTAAVVVIRDITDRSLRREQEGFMATASHELRTPIAALHGYVQLLERRLDPEKQPREAEYARVALAQARRVGGLLERLFDLAQLQTGRLEAKPAPMDLASIVQRSVAAADHLAPGLEVRVSMPDPRLRVLADADRLEQVLLNVLSNAIQHAPDTKAIDIDVGVADGRVQVAIRDYGPGIPKRRLSRVFAKRNARGTDAGPTQGLGLGLYISRELMRAQGGSIEIASDPGEGTTVTLLLPVAP
jgi:two-component system, chemotaxis family, CheB/CheR fusion protein